MPRSRRLDRERDEERNFQRYLEWRDQQREDEDEDDDYYDPDDYYDEEEEQPREQPKPVDVIRILVNSCTVKNRDQRVANFATLFNYILSVPDFVNANPNFREVAVNKAREFSKEPALVALCERIVAVYTPKG